MRLLLLLSVCLCQTLITSAQILGVIGSSTAFGEGASPDSGWVSRVAAYYSKSGQLTGLINLALPGSTSFAGMPASYTPAPGSYGVANSNNITTLITDHADIIVVAYPTNDLVLGVSMGQFLFNLRTMRDSAVAAGKKVWVTTTQPRNDYFTPMAARQALQVWKDSILLEFGPQALNFYDPVVDPVTLGILSQFDSGDGTHLNDAGHAVLAQTAITAGIAGPPIPLPLVLTDFKASWLSQQQNVLLQWMAANIGVPPGSVSFEVQRSADGRSFQPLYHTGMTLRGDGTYSWTDVAPLAGKSYYRLRWTQDQAEGISRIVEMDNPFPKFAIGKIYPAAGGAGYMAEIIGSQPGVMQITVVSASGRPVSRGTYTHSAGTTLIPIGIGRLPAGAYFLKVNLADGSGAVKPFTKL